MSKIRYSERIFNKVIILPFGILMAFLLVASFSINIQDLSAIRIIFPMIFLLVFFIHLYQLKIQVSESELKLSLGIGTFHKSYSISEIDLDSFQIEKAPFYLSGSGWKNDFKGNVIFSAGFGKALSFRLKNNSSKILIVTNNQQKLQLLLKGEI
ncbi:hypothetical protein [Psychroflexus aestuariivivens]|uniref:hypothetical protein n=1 Tax=Psychroflexus aestuariivivens TaxID=1795040 RepID=UPI000FDBF6E7|nr:hypothetical protein [Psychroflexus aestuariivivens]